MADKEKESAAGNLTASFIASSDMVYELSCEVCAEDDTHLEATGFCVDCQDYLCSDCIKHHGKNRASRNHTVQTKSQMPKQKPSQPLSKSSKLSCTEKCDHHPERTVEYFCKDDGSLACTVCLVKHRQCRAVDHISDISEQLLDSQEYQQITTSLTTLKTQSKNVIKSAKANKVQAENLYTDVATALQELRKQVMKVFDTLEGNMIKKAEAIKSADKNKIKHIIDKGEKALDEVEKISANLRTLESKNQYGQLFVKMIKFEDRIDALHNLLHGADVDNNVTVYKFEPGAGIQEIIDNPTSIGSLPVQAIGDKKTVVQKQRASNMLPVHQKIPKSQAAATATKSPLPTKNTRDMSAVMVGNINVKTKGDALRCQITGSALLPSNRLILTDYNNDNIKLVNLLTARVTAELNVKQPWNVASITEDLVAVTHIRDDTKISFVKVTTALKIDREMGMDGTCRHILYNGGKLILAFIKPLKIEIMTLDGFVLRKIECSSMFKSISHTAVSPGHGVIFVSDYSDDCVKKLNLCGFVEAKYEDKNLKDPGCVVVDQHDRVLVCGKGSGNIHLLATDLTNSKLLIDGLNDLLSFSLCQNTGKLYVGRSANDISVYQLSI